MERDGAIPLEITIFGVPVSQQTRRGERLEKWRQDIRSVASREWNEAPSNAGALIVTITYVYDDILLDVDNIPKPILDALKRVVYSDDDQIIDLLCRKRDLHANLQSQSFSTVLTEALARSTPLVHIVVDNAPDQEVIS